MRDEPVDLAGYLPGIFQEAAERDDSPLSAILYAAGREFAEIEGVLDEQDRFFDPVEAPVGERDFVAWLAAWVDLPVDESWSERKRRALVSSAAKLYRTRGTVAGLIETLRLFFDIQVEVEEWQWPRGMEIGMRSAIGLDTRLIEDADTNRCFQIRWRLESPPEERLVRRVRAVIDRERPANTACFLIIDLGPVERRDLPELTIGVDSTIGEFVIG